MELFKKPRPEYYFHMKMNGRYGFSLKNPGLKYDEVVFKYYKEFYKHNITVDFVASGADLGKIPHIGSTPFIFNDA